MAAHQVKRNRRRILLVVCCLLSAGALSLLFDTDITRQRHSGYVSGDIRRIIQLSEIFAHGFGIAVVLYLVWILAPARRRLIPRLAACAIIPGLVAQFIKLFIVRRRPGFYWPEFTDQVADTWVGVLPDKTLNIEYVTQSFPSAHARWFRR